MATIDETLDARLSADTPTDEERKSEKAQEVQEALEELGGANGEFTEFCREFLFAHKQQLAGADARKRTALLAELQDAPITVDGCTVSCPKSNTIRIGWNGEEYDYVFLHDSQIMYLGTSAGSDAIRLKDYHPAKISCIGDDEFHIATEQDMETYRARYAEAEAMEQRQEESRTKIRKVLDWLSADTPMKVRPFPPKETPRLYGAALTIAHRAQEALEAAKQAFEQLADPTPQS